MDKAITIAKESIDYLRSRFPPDDAKFADFIRSCSDMLMRLNWLEGEMREVEHENKSRYNDPCNCSKCDPEAKADKEFLDKCLKEAVAEDISEIKPLRTKGNPSGKMTLVYDKDKVGEAVDAEPCPCGDCKPETNELEVSA